MAEQATFTLTITNVDSPLFDGAVVSITVPASEGEMTILAHHEPTVTLLKNGTVTVRVNDTDHRTFDVVNGVLEVSNNHAIVLL